VSGATLQGAATGAAATGTLYVVATPIGNLEDITLRALRVLREVDAILAEDTRHTRRLCERHGVGTPLRAFHAHSSPQVLARIVAELVGGARLALVSDAGTPLVSDPGAALVAEAAAQGVRVEALPGASAPLTALAVAGLRADGFRFVGFFPRSGGRRTRALERLARDPLTTVLFEAPGRVGDTLRDLARVAGDTRRAAVCRELTKAFEEIARGPLGALATRFADGARGEVTIVVEGLGADAPETADDAVDGDALVRDALATGASVKDAARRLAEATRLGRREAYQRALAIAAGEAPRPEDGVGDDGDRDGDGNDADDGP
jgi:16S rRNA (cytidine1402-2'-O)-methyltransferase